MHAVESRDENDDVEVIERALKVHEREGPGRVVILSADHYIKHQQVRFTKTSRVASVVFFDHSSRGDKRAEDPIENLTRDFCDVPDKEHT